MYMCVHVHVCAWGAVYAIAHVSVSEDTLQKSVFSFKAVTLMLGIGAFTCWAISQTHYSLHWYQDFVTRLLPVHVHSVISWAWWKPHYYRFLEAKVYTCHPNSSTGSHAWNLQDNLQIQCTCFCNHHNGVDTNTRNYVHVSLCLYAHICLCVYVGVKAYKYMCVCVSISECE